MQKIEELKDQVEGFQGGLDKIDAQVQKLEEREIATIGIESGQADLTAKVSNLDLDRVKDNAALQELATDLETGFAKLRHDWNADFTAMQAAHDRLFAGHNELREAVSGAMSEKSSQAYELQGKQSGHA